MTRRMLLVLFLGLICKIEATAQADTSYIDIKPYLFQRAGQKAIVWDSTTYRWSMGLGTQLHTGQSLWKMQWKWKPLHAWECASSFTSPGRDFALNYLFHFGAYAYQSTKNRTHDLWSLVGCSAQGLTTALRYELSRQLPTGIWVESGIRAPWKGLNPSQAQPVQPYMSMGIRYAPAICLPRSKSQSLEASQKHLSVWNGAVFSAHDRWGSHWSLAWTTGCNVWQFGQYRLGLDRFHKSSVFHLGFDFLAPVFPANIPFQTSIGFGPEWHITQSASRTRHRFGYSWLLESTFLHSSGYTPFVMVQYQPIPVRSYRIGLGLQIRHHESDSRSPVWFTDWTEWLMGIPNLGGRVPLSSGFQLESLVSSAWFDTPKRTHRFQAIRVSGVFARTNRLGLSPSAHVRLFQYDFRYRETGEMGKAVELGLALAKCFPLQKIRIQVDVGYVNLKRSSYHWMEYAVRNKPARRTQYWGPTALRCIRYWGNHKEKYKP